MQNQKLDFIMHEELLAKIAEAEIKLDFTFPASIRRFLSMLKDWEYKFKEERSFFNIVREINSTEKKNSIVEDSVSFRQDWGLNGVLIAHNGVGDHLLVLPD
jgi:hypothetical protein